MKQPNPDARLWLFDFDNTLAELEREVDWPGSRRELEAFLRNEGLDEEIFVEIPKGNLPLYAALHTRWPRTPPTDENSPINVSRSTRSGDCTQLNVWESPHTDAKDARTPSAKAARTPSGLLMDAAGRPPREIAEALLRRASQIIERHELIGVDRAQPTPGGIDLLAALVARGCTVAVVTSNSSRTVARWLELHDISKLVQAIVGRDSLLALKPSPEMVLHARRLAAVRVADSRLASSVAKDASVGDGKAAFVGDRSAVLVGDNKPDSVYDSSAVLVGGSSADFAGDGGAAFVGNNAADFAGDGGTVLVGDSEAGFVADSEAVFVGDSEADLAAARAANVGFYGIAISHAARDRLVAAGAAEVFTSPAALNAHIACANKSSWDKSTE